MSVLIIAEAGVNHNGEKDKAFALIDVAAAAGADAVKFQTFNAERLAAMTAPKAAYQNRTTDASQSQLEMLKQLELPLEWHKELQAHAAERGIQFISTAFDLESLAFLEVLNLPFYKIPSGEITNGPLLLAFARTGKKVVLSTGMATLGEIEQALAILAWGYVERESPPNLEKIWQHWSTPRAGKAIAEKVSLLHCTSQYPTAMEEVNLRAIDALWSSFGLPVGYSDHTQGLLVPIAAVARGAQIIEKHFTLDRGLPGPDHKASLEPQELSQMVEGIRSIETALGDARKRPQLSEWDSRAAARQQIVAVLPIHSGEEITAAHLGTARAGAGESPVYLWDLIGTKATRNYSVGDTLER
ncbi:N-acetylneuraminate synthase [Marinobacter nauticus]|uniref:N-acetylneuraminate synthase n=1 Tax=Marinobacter nauticus TaxID=2743 RepID=A0A368XT62_MARNT|nr:N-acetylneuraminate synthase [Marinobacter nauticus]RCW71162.1 N-acetylneuraminate synthase [Marinobacter nauticus]